MFPGATNLIQPSNESVGSPLNVRNGRIYNPFGWDAQLVYVAHCPSRLITSYHRRLRSPALLAKSINQYMFYFWDSDVKSSVVCIHKHYFVTFRHGSHLQLRLGEQLIIYKAVSEPTKTFNATVVLINENLDFILLNTKEKIVERASSLVDPEESEGFLLSGYGNDNQELTCLTGIVHRDGVYVDGPNKTCLGPFILGMGTSSPGDAGAGCWSNQGFIGMNLGSLAILTAPHQTATANAALFSPKNYIVPSQHLEIALVTEIRKKNYAKHRRSHLQRLKLIMRPQSKELVMECSDLLNTICCCKMMFPVSSTVNSCYA
ncbi:hypothetical protein M3Y94_00617600 [Aphelenchoides besseyi]|nr:hypothetical protein M3Y94_00617600 [Aphelenchoides besseyi]